MKKLLIVGSVLLLSGCDDRTTKPIWEVLKSYQVQFDELNRDVAEIRQTLRPLLRLENGGDIQTNVTDMQSRIHDLEYRLDHLDGQASDAVVLHQIDKATIDQQKQTIEHLKKIIDFQTKK